jgi:hypothetical protein
MVGAQGLVRSTAGRFNSTATSSTTTARETRSTIGQLNSAATSSTDPTITARETRRRVQTPKATEKDAVELTEAQEAIIAAVESIFKPTIKGLTREVARLATALEEQIQQNETLRSGYEALNENYETLRNSHETLNESHETLKDMISRQFDDLKTELTASMGTQLSSVYLPTQSSRTYAEVAQTPPSNQQSNLASMWINKTVKEASDTPYCTIDTSGVGEEVQVGPIRTAIEKEIQESTGQENWRYVAVTRDPRNTARIKIACRNEEEHQAVKRAAEKTGAVGTRVLRDQLFPIKLGSVNRIAVLDEND